MLLVRSPEGSENKETKISELGKYISYCTVPCDNYYILQAPRFLCEKNFHKKTFFFFLSLKPN